MARTPDGPAPDPAVQKLRLRYAKRGRLRFASHRDFQRAFERAVRRAGLPIAYSAGFNPHPKISYANAAPTGAASEAEYLELSLTRRRDPDEVRAALDDALPDGLDVVEVVEAGPGALADRLDASVWRVELPGLAPEPVTAAVQAFLAADRTEVQRMTKNGLRTFDARAAVLSAEVRAGEGPADARALPGGSTGVRVAQVDPVPCAILQVVVRHTTPAVRPDDILAALRSQADLAPPSPPRMTRLAQGPLDEEDGSVADPLTADRGVGGA
ncbi:MAG TPA: TIGR03936 family radical SAM-associated protein [Kineosporiaceae bacterium]|nr:TIGR03936 family radical SAM-associated protein [Kineosporiaceae bacterium]